MDKIVKHINSAEEICYPWDSSPPARIDNLLSRVASGHAHSRRRSHHDWLHVTDDPGSQIAQVLLGLLSLCGDVGGFVVGTRSVEVVVGSGRQFVAGKALWPRG